MSKPPKVLESRISEVVSKIKDLSKDLTFATSQLSQTLKVNERDSFGIRGRIEELEELVSSLKSNAIKLKIYKELEYEDYLKYSK